MGRNWAIAIGINKYENFTSLKYAKQEAEAIADWVGQEAQFDEGLYHINYQTTS